MITQIIDYRNAKYQGQTKSSAPHGIGILFDYKNLFTLAQWKNGQINGRCLIVFGDSKIFYGSIRNSLPQGICTYHLKDKCQIFCNFQQNSSISMTKNLQQKESRSNRLVALLPSFNMIIKVEGDKEQQLIISDEQVYRDKDIVSIGKILQKMLNYKFQPNELDAYLSLQGFIKRMFSEKREYEGLLDTVQLANPDGGKELFFTLKTKQNQSSLGIRIQNCMQDSNSMTNLHNDGHSYIVKAVGMFNKEGILQYGLKNVKTLIKGNVKEEAIYNDQKSIIRYENQASRPKKCAAQILNFLKKSPYFTNKNMPTRHLYILQAQCLNINFNIKETQTKKYAQLILQNPKELTFQQKQKIEQGRNRKINNGSIQKNVSTTPPKDSYNRTSEKYQKESEQLLQAKQDIYRSVSKKKINGASSTSPYVHAGTNLSSSPEKEIKPAQLTNVKPILQLYKNTGDNSFYNSINKNGSSSFLTSDQNSQGYQFSINKKVDPKIEIKTPPPKYGGSMSADYIKSLQSRRRLYQESDLNRMPSVTQEPYNGSISRRKFNYLPDESQQISSRPVTHKLGYQRHIPNSQYNDTNDNELSFYTQSGFNEPQQSVYDPHKHYHDHSYPLKSEEQYFRSQRREGEKSRSRQKQDQTGKLGRRVTNKQRQLQGENSFIQGSKNNTSQKKINPYQPIIVPEFKINHTNIPSDYKRTTRDDSLSPNPKREHQLKTPYQGQSRKSPLKTQAYRKEYLENNTPIRKLVANYDGNQSRYKYEYNVIMDPGANFAKTRLQRDTRYGMNPINERSKSPLPKRKKILSDNPFDL